MSREQDDDRKQMVGDCTGCGMTYAEGELTRGVTPCCFESLDIWGTVEEAEALLPEDWVVPQEEEATKA